MSKPSQTTRLQPKGDKKPAGEWISEKVKTIITFLWNVFGTAIVLLGTLYLAGVKAYELLTTAADNDPRKFVLVGVLLVLASAAVIDRFVFVYKLIKNSKKK